MLKALQNLKAEFYVPLSERDGTMPTRFNLRPLDGIELLDVSYHRDEQGNLSLSSAAARSALKHGLLGWENLVDETGTQVLFNPVDRDMNLKRLPAELVVELSTEIFVRSILSEQERKNLSSLPTSRPSSESPSTAANAGGGGIATSPTPHPSNSGASPG
jgi:hypothetical protein